METVELIEPNVKLAAEHSEMLNEWLETGEHIVPFTLKYDTSDFEKYIQKLNDLKKGIGVPENFVPHSTFWLVNKNQKIIGVSNVRHYLNERLETEGGHIGYGIRPTERKKGYAIAILKLSLIEARKLKIDNVLVTCKKDNMGSAKTMIKNGGKLWKEHIFEGVLTQNYWIRNSN